MGSVAFRRAAICSPPNQIHNLSPKGMRICQFLQTAAGHHDLSSRNITPALSRDMCHSSHVDESCDLSYVRVEPILQRIKEDRTRIVSPSFDNIKYDTFEVEEYPLSAQGFDWELWCRYLNPPKSWWNLANHTAPIRYVGLQLILYSWPKCLFKDLFLK